MSIQPLGHNIVLEKLKSTDTVTTNGLTFPGDNYLETECAEVLEVGPKVLTVKPKELVAYQKGTAIDMLIGTEKYLVIKEKDVLVRFSLNG